MSEPVYAVEVIRGSIIESRHRASMAICDAKGRVIWSAGKVDGPVLPRSSVKPFQALPYIETGAYDSCASTPEELSLACASHSSEPIHVDTVSAWQKRIGIMESNLACGAHMPMQEKVKLEFARHGQQPDRNYNNCSGKHTAMLATAIHCKEPLEGYQKKTHPVQQRVLDVFQDLTGNKIRHDPSIDGCSLPNWPLDLLTLSKLASRLVDQHGLDPLRSQSLLQVRQAMGQHPLMVAGTRRCCTRIMEAAPHIVAKTGAEGVYIAASDQSGLAIALKVEDGEKRAAECLIVSILNAMGELNEEAANKLCSIQSKTLKNYNGEPVGKIEADRCLMDQVKAVFT